MLNFNKSRRVQTLEHLKRQKNALTTFPIELTELASTLHKWEQIQENPEAVWEENGSLPPLVRGTEYSRRLYPVRCNAEIVRVTDHLRSDYFLYRKAKILEEARKLCIQGVNHIVIFGIQPEGIPGLLSQTKGTSDPLAPNANAHGIPQVESPEWLSGDISGAEMYEIITKLYIKAWKEAVNYKVPPPDIIALGTTEFGLIQKIYQGTTSVYQSILHRMKDFGLKCIVMIPELSYSSNRAIKLAAQYPWMNVPNPYMAGNTLAETYAGGLFKRNVMVCFNHHVDNLAIILADEFSENPCNDLQDNQQMELSLSTAGLVVYEPQSIRIFVAPDRS